MKNVRQVTAAVAVSVAAGGCCCCRWCRQQQPAAPQTHPVARQDNHDSIVQFERHGGETQNVGMSNDPGNVNVFGEMKTLKAGPLRTVSEANFQQHTYLDDGYDADVAVDPTGKWLAFSSTRDSDHASLYMQRVDGTAVIQLTSDAADDANPAFSPDGRQIAFASTRAGNWQIFVMDADGKNVTQVTTGPLQAIHPSFSPDGARLVYSSLGGKSRQWELWTINLQTNEKRMIGYGLFPSWSPSRDVDRIAFQRPRQRGSRWFSIWTLELTNGDARHVTEVAVSSNAALLSPSWSPDGKRLAFASIMEPNTDIAPRSKGRTDVWTVNADGTERQRLTDGTGTNLMPFWSADNRVYFVSDRGGAECVWSARAEPGRLITVEAKKDSAKPQAADARDPDH